MLRMVYLDVVRNPDVAKIGESTIGGFQRLLKLAILAKILDFEVMRHIHHRI